MSSSPSIFCDDIVPIITDHFISKIVYVHAIDSAYGLNDAAKDMASYAKVFPHMLRQMYKRLNYLGEALQNKRRQADIQARNIVAGGPIINREYPIVLSAVELFQLRCLGYLEPILRELVNQNGCGRCMHCSSGGRCYLEKPRWHGSGLLILQ